jgi:GntR family transcriptional regulator, transcriptional repressor for pyruvate dehydrogenase complex
MELLPVKNTKLIDVVTKKIRDEILGGSYLPGDKLPPEHQFVDQLQVSRIVVREALRKLEAIGLLTVKRGAGMFVAGSDTTAVNDVLFSVLRIQKVGILEIIQAGLTIEPAIAELVAENRTSEHINALRANVERSEELIKTKVSSHNNNREFHRIIAEATQNRVLKLSVEAVLHVLNSVHGPFGVPTCGDDALIWHSKILQAIEDKKPREAARLMRDHITEVRKGVERVLKSGSTS